jgi:hypothetical protein
MGWRESTACLDRERARPAVRREHAVRAITRCGEVFAMQDEVTVRAQRRTTDQSWEHERSFTVGWRIAADERRVAIWRSDGGRCVVRASFNFKHAADIWKVVFFGAI